MATCLASSAYACDAADGERESERLLKRGGKHRNKGEGTDPNTLLVHNPYRGKRYEIRVSRCPRVALKISRRRLTNYVILVSWGDMAGGPALRWTVVSGTDVLRTRLSVILSDCRVRKV